jgi:hypothetical protein
MTKQPDAPIESSGLQLVLFALAGQRFAVEAHRVRHTLVESGRSPDSLDAAGLLGLQEDAAPSASQLLMIKDPAGEYRVRVSPPVELRTVPATEIFPPPAMLASCCRLRGLRALAMIDHQLVPLVSLLRSER